MIVDVERLSHAVQRLDRSSTLKSFVALLAPLLVLLNVSFYWEVLNEGFSEKGDLQDTLSFVATVVMAIILAFAPLGLAVSDWLARRPIGRRLAMLVAAAQGAIGVALLGLAIAVAYYAGYAALELPLDAMRIALIAFCVLETLLLGGWMIAVSPRERVVYATVAAILVIVPIVTMAIWFFVAGDLDGEDAMQTLLAVFAQTLFFAWIVRAIALRITVAGDCPRALLFGGFRQARLGTRLASLIGLPSSLWHWRALRTSAFWALVLARPLVYFGLLAFYATLEDDDAGIAYYAVGTLFVLIGHGAFLAGKRLAARAPWRPADTHEAQAPILFLRSFDDDQFSFRRPAWKLVARWFDLWSFRRNADEVMVDELAQYGPVVALGKCGDTKTPFGASRYYATHEEWQDLVIGTVRSARAIVIVAGDSPNVLWELELLSRERRLADSIVLFRPGVAAPEFARRALNAYGADVAGAPMLPADTTLVALMYRNRQPLLVTAKTSSAAACVVALRMLVLQE